jgi:hypothetical protein
MEAEKKLSLYELVSVSNQFRQYLIENNGEITDEMIQSLAIVEKGLPEKVDSYKFIIEEMEHEAEKWKERSEEFLKAHKTYKKFAEKLKENLKLACVTMNVTELKGNTYRWKLQSAKPSVIIDNPEVVPSSFKEIRQETVIKKDEILKAIQAGEEINGCRLEESSYVRCYLKTK